MGTGCVERAELLSNLSFLFNLIYRSFTVSTHDAGSEVPSSAVSHRGRRDTRLPARVAHPGRQSPYLQAHAVYRVLQQENATEWPGKKCFCSDL